MVDYDLAIGESHKKKYTGKYGYITIDLILTVLCVENFEGSECTECIPGFTGTDCQTNIDDCEDVDCSGNGQCLDGVNSFKCVCDPGYTGLLCDNTEGTAIASEYTALNIDKNFFNIPFKILMVTTLVSITKFSEFIKFINLH